MTSVGDEGRLYREFAWLYDAIARPRPSELRFYEGLAQRAGGPVLEPACGSGRLLAPLRQSGFEVWGCDAEPAMVALALGQLASEPGPPYHVAVQSLAALEQPVRAGLLLLPLDALRLAPDDATLLSILARCHHHLRAGGTLAADLYLPADRRDQHGQAGPYAAPDGGTAQVSTRWRVDGEWDVEETHIVSRDGHGRPAMARSLERYRRIALPRLLDVLAQAGFEPPQLWSSFDQRTWHSRSDWVALAARRA